MARKFTEVSEMIDVARETLAESLLALQSAQARVIQELSDDAAADKPYDEKRGSHLAWVAAKIAEITSALRQLEKHDRIQGKTPEQRQRLILAYVQTQATPDQRAEIAAAIAQVESARLTA